MASGVQWLMDLDAKLEGARAMVKELSNSEKAADSADRAFKKLESHSFLGMAKEIFKAELALKGLEKGAELAWEGVKKVGEKLWESINIAAGEQRTAKVFGNMLGQEEGREVFEYLDKFADLSEFLEGSIKTFGIELERAGLRGASFRNAMAMAIDVAAQAPDKMAGMSEAVSSLSRIKLLGKIGAGTLMGLRLDPHEVERQISQDLGLSRKAIAKQLEDGTLDGTKAMQSIFTVMEKKTGKQLGALGLEMASGLEAKLTKFKSIPDEMAQNLRNTQGFKDIEDALGNFLDTVRPKLLSTNGVMGNVLDAIGAKVKNIDWDQMLFRVEGIVKQMEKWAPIAEALAKSMAKVSEAMLALPNLGETLGDIAARVRHPFTPLGDSEERRKSDWNLSEWEKRQAVINSKLVVRGAVAGMSSGAGEGKKAGSGLASAIDAGFTERAEVKSPSRLFMRHGEMLAEGLAQGMESGARRVATAAAAMMPAPSASGLSPASGGGIHVGGMTFQISVDVAGGSGASASDIAHEVQAILPNMLIGVLEQVAAQAGGD